VVVETAARWKRRRRLEEVGERVEEELEVVDRCYGRGNSRTGWSSLVDEAHPAAAVPEGQAMARAIPVEGSQGAQPAVPQDQLVALQRNDEDVDLNGSPLMMTRTARQMPEDCSRSPLATLTWTPLRGSGDKPRRAAVEVAMKVCVDPESTKAVMGTPVTSVSRRKVSVLPRPVMAHMETSTAGSESSSEMSSSRGGVF